MEINGKKNKKTITSGDLYEAARIVDIILLIKYVEIIENYSLSDERREDWLFRIIITYAKFAIPKNDIEFIKYIIAKNFFLDNLANKIAMNNKPEMMDLLHENGFKFPKNIGLIAAKSGSIDVLKYLNEIDFKFNEETFIYASENGHLDCVIFLHNIGVPINVDKCNNIENDAIIQWGLENNIIFPRNRSNSDFSRHSFNDCDTTYGKFAVTF
jgi:hypothetical protein